jgi:hypothetical protein
MSDSITEITREPMSTQTGIEESRHSPELVRLEVIDKMVSAVGIEPTD